MKNKICFSTFFIVFIIFFFYFCQFTSASPSLLITSGPMCSGSGNILDFTLTNNGDQDVETSLIKIIARPYNGGQAILIKGKWESNIIKTLSESYSSSHVNFKSEDGQLLLKGDYILYINYSSNEDSIQLERKFNCVNPVIFACSFVNLSISECYSKDNYLYFKFKAVNIKQSISLDIYRDLEYDIEARNKEKNTSRIWSFGNLPEGIIIDNLGDDNNLARIPSESNILKEVTIRVKPTICDNKDYPYAQVREWRCQNNNIESPLGNLSFASATLNIVNNTKDSSKTYPVRLLQCIGNDWILVAGGEKVYCDSPDYAMYLDKTGVQHCASPDFSNVTDGSWCPKLVLNSSGQKTDNNNAQKNFFINYKFYILGGMMFIVLLGSIIYFVKKKNKLPKIIKKEQNVEKKVQLEKETKEEIPNEITEAITISGLGVKRGSTTILENINFSVKRGEFVSLLGPSGSGKSTIIEILAGRKKPSQGKIKIFGKSFDKEGINYHVGFVPQGNEIYLNQTVLKNLENSAIKWGIKNSNEKISNVLEQVNLSERKNLIASKLSGGQQKLLSLAMELIREPELLILDEPTTGLDPNTRNQIITLLCNLSQHNKKTILITTHFMDDSEECDEVIMINNKKVVASGSPDKLKRMLPGSGKIVTLVLDNSSKDLIDKIKKISGVERVIAEGRTLNILTNNPHAVEIANRVNELGGYVNESKISKATMKEVFVFFTGKNPEE